MQSECLNTLDASIHITDYSFDWCLFCKVRGLQYVCVCMYVRACKPISRHHRYFKSSSFSNYAEGHNWIIMGQRRTHAFRATTGIVRRIQVQAKINHGHSHNHFITVRF